MSQLNSITMGGLEKTIRSFSVVGQVEPYAKILSEDSSPQYKIVDAYGNEYFLQASDEMKKKLSEYVWKKVKIIGTMSRPEMILIPHKIMEDITPTATFRRKRFLRKVGRILNDFVFVPLAVLVVLAS